MSATLAAKFVRPEFQHLEKISAFILGLPDGLREGWKRVCQEVVTAGRVRELHDARDEFRGVYDSYLTLIESVTSLADTLDSPLATEFRRVEEEVRQLRDNLFSNWNSQEDLEELLVESFPLPEWLNQGEIPPHLRPPQSWYEETTNPFTAE